MIEMITCNLKGCVIEGKKGSWQDKGRKQVAGVEEQRAARVDHKGRARAPPPTTTQCHLPGEEGGKPTAGLALVALNTLYQKVTQFLFV